MNERFSVKLNREFSRAFKKGTRKGGRYLLISAVRNRRELSRLGISVGKKFGNSVQRSRFKRLVREVFRELRPEIDGSYDIIVAARPSKRIAVKPSRKLRAEYIPNYNEIRTEMVKSFEILGIIRREATTDINEKNNEGNQ